MCVLNLKEDIWPTIYLINCQKIIIKGASAFWLEIGRA